MSVIFLGKEKGKSTVLTLQLLQKLKSTKIFKGNIQGGSNMRPIRSTYYQLKRKVAALLKLTLVLFWECFWSSNVYKAIAHPSCFVVTFIFRWRLFHVFFACFKGHSWCYPILFIVATNPMIYEKQQCLSPSLNTSLLCVWLQIYSLMSWKGPTTSLNCSVLWFLTVAQTINIADVGYRLQLWINTR